MFAAKFALYFTGSLLSVIGFVICLAFCWSVKNPHIGISKEDNRLMFGIAFFCFAIGFGFVFATKLADILT